MTPELAANLPRKRGRPRDELRALLRQQYPDWSDRTFQTAWAAFWRIMIADKSAWERAVRQSQRANGALNVSALSRYADAVWREYVWRQRMASAARESPEPGAI